MITTNAFWMWMSKQISTASAESVDKALPSEMPPHAPGSPQDNAAPMADIHDIKPIVDLGNDWWQWFVYLGGGIVIVLVLSALVWWLWKKRRKPEKNVSQHPPLTPEAEAYNALDTLAAGNGLNPKQFYFQLSAVLRCYIERRFHFPAAEMTTEELLPKVDQLPLDSSLAREFKTLCRKIDPIKFAGANAQKEQLAGDLAFSRDFIRQTTSGTQISENENHEMTQAPKRIENKRSFDK